jgi:aspartokinase/homoserine dehydrogenase 1
MRVLKFGGSSVGNPGRVKEVIGIILNHKKKQAGLVVVFSAFQGVTNTLVEMGKMASAGDDGYISLMEELKTTHFNMVKALIPVRKQCRVNSNILSLFKELGDTLQGVSLIRELPLKTQDLIMSFGERLSTWIIFESIREQEADAEFLDARLIIKCDENFGSGRVIFNSTDSLIEKYFKDHAGLQIVTGFIASTLKGDTITLGRGGSDYTASILGAALRADEIEIWTDVDGVMSADPRRVPEAFPIPYLSYDEAMEMSHFGAKVIYPPTMYPATQNKIPLRIMNTLNPSFPGTLIGEDLGSREYAIKGVSSIDDVSVLLVQGSGLVGVAGAAKRVFSALAGLDINAILISQASSEHSICIAVLPHAAEKAKSCIEEEFRYEILTGGMKKVLIQEDLSIITVVGSKMIHSPGCSGKLFSSLGRIGVNIVAIAQGSSELNISAVISKQDLTKALIAIHGSFFNNGARSVNLFIAGTGLTGSTLLKQIEKQGEFLKEQERIKINIKAVANSRQMTFSETGIAPGQWQKALTDAGEKTDVRKFIERIKEMNPVNAVLVDCTPGDELARKYKELLSWGISVVTPNKRANSGAYSYYLDLHRASLKSKAKFLYEANVGAGLPVIRTLRDLILSGDEIFSIEGVLSGSLSYIFNTYNGSIPFADVVKEARERGFTEPDPRDDLNGTDVARKLLILARECGYNIEYNDLEIEKPFPENLNTGNTQEEFFDNLSSNESWFRNLYKKAAGQGKVLRYIASYENKNARISLQLVGKEHPFYQLGSNDNIIAVKSKYYNNRPLVIQGPGAGADVTASAIFADIIKIAD